MSTVRCLRMLKQRRTSVCGSYVRDVTCQGEKLATIAEDRSRKDYYWYGTLPNGQSVNTCDATRPSPSGKPRFESWDAAFADIQSAYGEKRE
jgi:hypothetical protein